MVTLFHASNPLSSNFYCQNITNKTFLFFVNPIECAKSLLHTTNYNFPHVEGHALACKQYVPYLQVLIIYMLLINLISYFFVKYIAC